MRKLFFLCLLTTTNLLADVTDPSECQATQPNKSLTEIVSQLDSSVWYNCIQSLEKVPKIASMLKNMNDYQAGRYNRMGYWHNLEGEKNFGLLCDQAEESSETTNRFVFLSASGFKQVITPKFNEADTLRANGFSYQDKDYFVTMELGDYLEVYPRTELSVAGKESRDAIKKYEAKPRPKNKLLSVSADQEETAKACVKARFNVLFTWASWLTADELTDTDIYNQDIKKDFKSPELLSRYARTVEQFKDDKLNNIYKTAPACKSILTKSDLEKIYLKDEHFQHRIKLYNRMRGYLGLE